MRANAKARTKANARGDDQGNLMLLAGIIVTIAFILTALTLEQVGSLERQAAAEPAVTLAGEWRFIHDRIASNVDVSITETTTPVNFETGVFPAIAATFRAAEAEKGYDVTMRVAGAGALVNKTEASVVTENPVGSGVYVYGVRLADGSLGKVTSYDAAYDYTGKSYDNVNDGMLAITCPNGYAGTCIAGVLVSVRLSDGTSTLEEVVLFTSNLT